MKIKVLTSLVRLPLIFSYFYQGLLDEVQCDEDDDTVIDIEYLKDSTRKLVLEVIDSGLKTTVPSIEHGEIAGHLFLTHEILKERVEEITSKTTFRYVDLEYFDSTTLMLLFESGEN